MTRAPVLSAVVGLLAAALSLLVAPEPFRLGPARAGDAGLAGRVEAVLAGDTLGYRGLAVAEIDGGRTVTAMLGDSAGGPLFEIGSVTKTLTGMLFADMVVEGLVRPDETLGDALSAVRFEHDATASITLAELASHRSGLPRLAPGIRTLARSALAGLLGVNPYAGQDADAILDAARRIAPDDRGTFAYSNFGMALLGQALAARAGKPYPELVTQRILQPLGMSDTYVTVPDPRPAGLASGSIATGHSAAAWSGAGYAPAGVGVRSTAADLSRLVLATMAGTAPGADAAEPRFAADDGDRIGYGWFTHRYGNRTITWHNGGTGGFRSYVAFDRASGRGVVVLSNTDRAVEWIGLRMLGVDPPSAAGWRDLLRPGVTVALLMFAAGSLLLLAVRTARGSQRRGPDRLRVLEETLATAAMLLIAHRIGAWLTIPPWWWSAAVGVAAAGVTALALRWRTTPTRDGRGPAARSAQFAVSGAISLLIIGAMAAHL